MVFSAQEQQQLESSLRALPYLLGDKQHHQITAYLQALLKWNKVYNLTGFKTFQENLLKNLLDCLYIAPYIQSENNLDVGTGAGLPGLLMAVVKPQQSWVLLDSNGKKMRFLQQMRHELDLNNLGLVNERAENYQPESKFQGISSRAFDKIPATLQRVQHLLADESYFYAMKGKPENEELHQLPDWAKLEGVHPIKVPALEEQRHLIIIRCKHS